LNANPKQLRRWNEWRNHWISSVRPLTVRAIAICEYSKKLHELLQGLNFPSDHLWNDEKESGIKKIVDVYNRADRAASKVELKTYGLRFYDNDFDIMAPSSMTQEEVDSDHVTLGGLVLMIIGAGMIVIGLALKVSEHLERRERQVINDQKLEIAKTLKNAGASAPAIKDAIDGFNLENNQLAKKAGLVDLLFGSSSGMWLAGALGIGVLLFAYTKGRK
jgi:hypothetical protein